MLIGSECYNKFIVNYHNVFANSDYVSENVTNLEQMKGMNDFSGNNLTIIRSYGKVFDKHIQDLYNECFHREFNAIGLFYLDVLIQGLGRSLGNRGSKSADALINKYVYKLIGNHINLLPYGIDTWNVEISDETKKAIKDDMAKRNSYNTISRAEMAKSRKEEKLSRIKNGIMSSSKKDVITKDDLNGRFGKGYTIVDVQKVFAKSELKRVLIEGKKKSCLVGVKMK